MSNIGKIIEFNANRITEGNPVQGEIIQEYKDFYVVKLAHTIVGINIIWFQNDEKMFNKNLITDVKIREKN